MKTALERLKELESAPDFWKCLDCRASRGKTLLCRVCAHNEAVIEDLKRQLVGSAPRLPDPPDHGRHIDGDALVEKYERLALEYIEESEKPQWRHNEMGNDLITRAELLNIMAGALREAMDAQG